MRACAFHSIIAALLLSATPALTQTYPTHPVSIVVGYPPGATSDLLARTVGDPLATALGQPVVIDNRPGAAATSAQPTWRGRPATDTRSWSAPTRC